MTSSIQAVSFEEFAVNVMIKENHNWVKNREKLKEKDKITTKQAKGRIRGILYWTKHFNHMFPKVNSRRESKDIYEIMLHETRGVNYWSYYKDINQDGEKERYGVLDNGDSFGIWSMQWDTAYWIAKINNWGLNNRNDEEELMNDTWKQTKYAVWYKYWVYNFMYNRALKKGVKLNINQLRYASIQGYNYLDIDPTTERTRKYFFTVLGKITYRARLMKGE